MGDRADPRGKVYVVGAGPGDPGLMTVRGAEVLAQAEVVVYDGLVSPSLLQLAPPACERIYGGTRPSATGGRPLRRKEIDRLIVDRASSGRVVVRLKGGDPFLFARGAEELEAVVTAGIPFEVVPGVSAATAVPAYAGIPLTSRTGVSVVALVAAEGNDESPPVDWVAAARADTAVLFMAAETLDEAPARMIEAGRPASTPAAVVEAGTTGHQRTVVAPLGELAARARAAGMRPPALAIVGEVVRLREQLDWWARRPLHGAAVLVPRQPEQARPFARLLGDLGAEPVVCPVTHLVAPDDPAPLAAALATLPGGYRWLAFTSATAVERVLATMMEAGRDARAFAGVRLAAVGDATAAALWRHGLRADLVSPRQDGLGLAAALAAADPELAGASVLLPGAAEGRTELAAELARLGVRVVSVPAYRSVPAPAAELAPVLARLRAGELTILTFFAPSQVEVIVAALGAEAAAVLGRAATIAAIGPTTAAALAAHGVRVDLVPHSAGAEELAAALAARHAARTPNPVSPEDR